MSQWKYVTKTLKIFGMIDCQSKSSPMQSNYLCTSKLGIRFAFDVVSQFCNKPKKTHWKVAPCVLKDIVATLNYGIFYNLIVDNIRVLWLWLGQRIGFWKKKINRFLSCFGTVKSNQYWHDYLWRRKNTKQHVSQTGLEELL